MTLLVSGQVDHEHWDQTEVHSQVTAAHAFEPRRRLLSQIPTPSGHGWIAETEDPLLELYLLVGVPSREVAQGATPSVRLALVGELCVYSAPLVKPDLIGAASADGLLVLDLSDVTFCDAAGIGLLVSVRNELERRHIGLAIERVSRPVSHLLTMTGVAEQFSRAETSVSQPSTSVAEVGPDVVGGVGTLKDLTRPPGWTSESLLDEVIELTTS